MKRSLEQYQRQRYPFLEHSVVFDGGSKSRRRGGHRSPQSRSESERERRLRKELHTEPSQKDILRSIILEQLTAARSVKAFFLRLKRLGLHLYRRGQTVAVQDLASGRRYRLRTLGLEEAFRKAQQQWQELPGTTPGLRGAGLSTSPAPLATAELPR